MGLETKGGILRVGSCLRKLTFDKAVFYRIVGHDYPPGNNEFKTVFAPEIETFKKEKL